MRQFDRNKKIRAEAQAVPLDPIALTLALWLGLIVGVTGLMRLSENAAANAARVQHDPQHTSMMAPRTGSMLLSAYRS